MKKLPLGVIGLLQAVGVGLYISLVALFVSNASHWFAPPGSFWGPLLFLTLFAFSAVVCSLIYTVLPGYLLSY